LQSTMYVTTKINIIKTAPKSHYGSKINS